MATKTGELREALIDAIERVKNHKMDASEATAIAKLASAVNASIQTEIRAVEVLIEMGAIKKPALGELALGEVSRGIEK